LEEGHKILEINGIHPGMLGTLGPDHLNKGEIYNTGDRFAQYLKDESQKARRANEYVA